MVNEISVNCYKNGTNVLPQRNSISLQRERSPIAIHVNIYWHAKPLKAFRFFFIHLDQDGCGSSEEINRPKAFCRTANAATSQPERLVGRTQTIRRPSDTSGICDARSKNAAASPAPFSAGARRQPRRRRRAAPARRNSPPAGSHPICQVASNPEAGLKPRAIRRRTPGKDAAGAPHRSNSRNLCGMGTACPAAPDGRAPRS
jgi:hypothetical protein